MAKLIVSPLARADMREIGDYISRDLRNPDAALRMIRRFRETMSCVIVVEPVSRE